MTSPITPSELRPRQDVHPFEWLKFVVPVVVSSVALVISVSSCQTSRESKEIAREALEFQKSLNAPSVSLRVALESDDPPRLTGIIENLGAPISIVAWGFELPPDAANVELISAYRSPSSTDGLPRRLDRNDSMMLRIDKVSLSGMSASMRGTITGLIVVPSAGPPLWCRNEAVQLFLNKYAPAGDKTSERRPLDNRE